MIALAMIVKGTADEAPLLDACLESIKDHVDGIFIQLNAPEGMKISPKVRVVAEKYTNNIRTYIWGGNYVAARRDNFAQVPKKYDFIMFLDSDDIVENPEKIREICSITPKDVHSIYVQYDYDHDEWGNVLVSHWNCRIVRNNGTFSWKSSIDDSEVSVHETLVPNRKVKQGSANEFKIIHQADNARRNQSLVRNIELLEEMYERQKGSRLDPRILFYLGTHYYDAGMVSDSQEMFYEYLKLSGWKEERSEAHVFMGKIFRNYEKKDTARTAFLQALGETNRNIGAYLELGRLDAEEQRYDQAVTWLRAALAVKQGPQAMILFSAHYDLYMLLAECLTELGGKSLTEALKWAEKAVKLKALDPEAVERRDRIASVVDYQKDMKAIARMVRRLSIDDEKDKIPALIDNLPKSLADTPVVVGARQEFKKAIKWPKKSIVIYCGGSPLGIWGPWSLKEGIGGSEEAVIRLSKELTKLGWLVTVYATPGERAGDYDGIQWKQYWEFNPDDEFDILVAWRMPSFFDLTYKAHKRYLWLHDVMELTEFTPERLQNLHKVIVLSKYHRSLFPTIPSSRIFLSANGITPEDFNIKPVKRDPHRIIYMSSHIRGLALIYDIWPDVKKAVPDAKLDIYYGWESYVNMNHNNPGNQPGGMAWMRMMQNWITKLDGVTDYGKIGQAQIVEEISKSGVWAYPCPFPEIYCITAIKAQAGGAVPVSSDFAALKETVRYGNIIHMKQQDEDTPVGKWDKKDVAKYKEALIDMLKDTDKQERIRPKMMAWGRTQSWVKVGKEWSREFNK